MSGLWGIPGPCRMCRLLAFLTLLWGFLSNSLTHLWVSRLANFESNFFGKSVTVGSLRT